MKNYEFINNDRYIFTGFYESYLFNEATIAECALMDDIDSNKEYYDIDNFESYCNEIGEYATELLYGTVYDKGIISKMKFKEIDSPAYYNYITDRLVISIDFNLKKLKEFCFKTHKLNFNGYLKKHYTSYDGFWSNVANNLSDFKRDYKTTRNDMCINVMLEYYILTCLYNTYSPDEMTSYEIQYHWSLGDFAYENLWEHLKLYKYEQAKEA